MSLLDTNFDVTKDQLFEIFIKKIVSTYFDPADNKYIFIKPKKTIKHSYKYYLMMLATDDMYKKIIKFVPKDKAYTHSYKSPHKSTIYMWIPLNGVTQIGGELEYLSLSAAKIWFNNQEEFNNYYEPIR